MSTFLPQVANTPGNSHSVEKQPRPHSQKWLTFFFWMAVAALMVGAVMMRLYHLDVHFDRDGYDEGVYWQSLRAMFAGQSLYHTVFYSQPPMFLLSVYPGFALAGGTLWSARFGIVLASLLGFPGAYLLGRSLAGRTGTLAALLLLVTNTLYLSESQTIQAEAPSVAFTILALALAFFWWKYPDGRRGICLAALTGIALALSILSKLLCVAALVPAGLLLLARAWQIWHRQAGTNRQSWLPILAGVGSALLTILLIVLPFLGSFQDFWSGVITFHQVAGQVFSGTLRGNFHVMHDALFSPLSAVALYGGITAFLRKDWRVIPLLVWLLATLLLLLFYHPLFQHHLIALEPPFLALAILGIVGPAPYETWLARWKLARLAPCITALGLLLVLGATCLSLQQELSYYNSIDASNASTMTQENVRVATDLDQAITPDQWVITDGQFIAGLADRNVPPSLVDTSEVRISSGYLTLVQLEQMGMNPHTHAILFYTGRFYMGKVAGFHAWVAQHFHLVQTYNPGQELWVR